MTHEPECPGTTHTWDDDEYYCCADCNPGVVPPWERNCICEKVRSAYQRGWTDRGNALTVNEHYIKGYREGYNDHARSRAHAEAMYGPYTQHGKGENP